MIYAFQDSNGDKRRKLQDPTPEVKDKDGTQIQQVKDKIKVLCTQSQPSEALNFLSLDELSKLARKVNHEDMDVYKELFRQGSRMQGKINMGNLCLTVLGGKVAGTVTKAINKCLMESGTSEVKRDNTSCKEFQQICTHLCQCIQWDFLGLIHMHLNMEGDTCIGQ